MKAKGGNGSIFLQSLLFNLTFFTLFAYYSHGDSRNDLDRGLRALVWFDFPFILHKW